MTISLLNSFFTQLLQYHGLETKDAIEEGMKEMSNTYTEKGSELYVEPKELK